MEAEIDTSDVALDYESQAKKDGWAPKEEWKGDESKWKSAEQFVKDGEQITRILKSKVDRLEERVTQLLDTNKEVVEFTKKAQERDKAEKDRLIKELKQLKRQAVTDGDGDAFDKAESQLEELQQAPEPKEDRLTPIATQWLESNPWYNTNEQLATYADGLSDRLVARGFNPQSKSYFDELTEQVKAAFPQEFENKNRKKPNGVEDGNPVESSQSHTFDDLPAEAKKAYARFARDIKGYTKADYLANYDWE